MTYQLTEDNTVIKDGNITISLANPIGFPNTNSYYLEYQDWLAAGNTPLPVPVNHLDVKNKLIKDLEEIYEEIMKVISSAYPPSERESWSVQTEEAKAILLDSEAVTPWIDAASIARGIDRLLLAQRIVKKDSDYRSLHGKLTGIKQKIEDEINAAGSNIEELQAIDVKTRWPEVT